MVKERANGFLLIDKPEGWSSFDVCKKSRGICQSKKIGHSGTLDPFATGLLIIGVNEATKILSYVPTEPKEYVATLSLGKQTSTGDCTGEVIKEENVPSFTREKILEIFTSLLGEQEQIPPMASAVHVNGIKLYKLAHQGIEIERKPRKINIFSLNLIDFNKKEITFKCSVSSGTYIRTLGETIANKLSTVGHLKSLRRTKIKNIDISEAKKIDNISISDLKNIADIIDLPTYILDGRNLELARHGNAIKIDCQDDQILIIDSSKKPIGIYQRKDDKIFVAMRCLNI